MKVILITVLILCFAIPSYAVDYSSLSASAINFGFAIWGFSTGGTYGIVTGILFSCRGTVYCIDAFKVELGITQLPQAPFVLAKF